MSREKKRREDDIRILGEECCNGLIIVYTCNPVKGVIRYVLLKNDSQVFC